MRMQFATPMIGAQDPSLHSALRFESDQKSVEMKVTRQEVVELALYWAMNFYRTGLLRLWGLGSRFSPSVSG
jgi:hypothetical protein